MKAVIFAYHDMGCVGVTALINAGYTIEAIITHPDAPSEKTFFGSVARIAAEHNIPVFAPDDVNHPLWIARIKALAPDVIFSFYYRQLLCQEILSLPTVGAFNLHGSLLPHYRGRSPLNWVLVNGEQETGVTLHRMTARADAGAILAQRSVAITPQDDALTLHRKLCEAAAVVLENVLPAIREQRCTETPQDDSAASYVGSRTPEDGRIDWCQPAATQANLVRAVTDPWPGAFSHAGGEKFIMKAQVRPNSVDAQPGTVLSIEPLVIACGSDALEVQTGQSQQGVYMQGGQLAQALGLVKGALLNPRPLVSHKRRTRVLNPGRKRLHRQPFDRTPAARRQLRDLRSGYWYRCDKPLHGEPAVPFRRG